MNGRLFLGILLLLVGVGLILEVRGVWDFGDAWSTYWPLLLVVAGVLHLSQQPRAAWGWTLVAAGTLLLLWRLDIIPGLTDYVWPVVLIALAVVLIFGALGRRRPLWSRKNVVKAGFDRTVLFGGSQDVVRGRPFKGGSVTAIFGGADVDLREATLPDEGADLEATAIFGGVEIQVPPTMHIEVEGNPLFGAFENRAETATDGPVLRIHGTALFGGVEINNHKK